MVLDRAWRGQGGEAMYWQCIHPDLQVSVQEAVWRDGTAGGAIVHLCGELDMASSPPAGRYLRELLGSHTGLELDLSRIGFFDASALRMVEEVIERMQAQGVPVTIRSPSQAVRRVFELCEANELCDLTTAAPEVTGGVARVLEAALSEAQEVVAVDMATAQLADNAGLLHLVAHPGFGDAFAQFFQYVEADDESAFGVAAQRHSAVWVSSVEKSSIFKGKRSGVALLEAGANAMGSVPLGLSEDPLIGAIFVYDKLFGVISVYDKRPRVWRAREQQHLVGLGRATALALAELPRARPH